MRTHFKSLTALILLLWLVGLACSLSDVPGLASSPTPILTPTPLSDTFTFDVPAYTVRLSPGDRIPGTGLEYVSSEGSSSTVRIDGLEAVKRPGDSFVWSGVVAPGVFGNYDLRLAGVLLGKLPAAGPVELIIFNPEPVRAELPSDPQTDLHYHSIIIDHNVPINSPIPGTSLSYAGIEQSSNLGSQGTRMAKLTGLEGYPNLALGDSLVWNGRLRDNVAVRFNLRVVSFDEQHLRLAGTAEVWITS